MKPHLSIHMEEVLDIALSEKMSNDEKTAAINDVFEKILVEVGYIDQRRIEAEDAMRLMLISLKNKKD